MDASLMPKELRDIQNDAPREKVNKVVTNSVKVKKPSLGKKFADVFLNEDVGSLKEYIIYDQIIPAIRNAVADTLINTVEMTFFGRVYNRGYGTRRARSNRDWAPAPTFSYDRVDERRPSGRRDDGYSTRRSNQLDEIVIETLAEAEGVMEELLGYLEKYGQVSVAAYYEACGVSSNRPYTDEKWGWTTLRNARVIRVRDGYTLELPRPEPL